MKLEKAIEFNQALEKDIRVKGMTTFADAIKLGNEALKRHQFQRTHYRHLNLKPLPGETE